MLQFAQNEYGLQLPDIIRVGVFYSVFSARYRTPVALVSSNQQDRTFALFAHDLRRRIRHVI